MQLGADRPVAGGIGLGILQEMVLEAFLNIFLVLFGVGGEHYLKGTFLDDDRSNRWFSRPSKDESSTRGYSAVQMITGLVVHTIKRVKLK